MARENLLRQVNVSAAAIVLNDMFWVSAGYRTGCSGEGLLLTFFGVFYLIGFMLNIRCEGAIAIGLQITKSLIQSRSTRVARQSSSLYSSIRCFTARSR